MKIDVDAVMRARLPRHYRYMPRIAVKWLERFIRQDGLNALLESNAGLRGADFCAGVLRDLDVEYRVSGEELLPPPTDRKVTLVSNHPLGALDGIALIDYVSRRYGGKVRFVVNDLLTAVEPLRDVFVPINKHGRQNRGDAAGVDEAFASDDPVLVFPAGMCSRRSGDGVRDLAWHKMFVNKSIEYRRTVIPLFFDGENSKFFYNFAKIRTALGIK
ncbi:MAG: glycerol acyltransferase, partial [Muribaculaceae bacterium]|nr:glycerol acyltransferase [Muribaculaceae bacterium]